MDVKFTCNSYVIEQLCIFFSITIIHILLNNSITIISDPKPDWHVLPEPVYSIACYGHTGKVAFKDKWDP